MANLGTSNIFGDLRVRGLTESAGKMYEEGMSLEEKYASRSNFEALESLTNSIEEAVSGLGDISVINKSNSATNYLRGDGIWASHGNLINLSKNNSSSHYLRGDGNWSAHGDLIDLSTNGSTSHYLRGDGAWAKHGDLISLSSSGLSSQFLRGDGVWVTMSNALNSNSETSPLTAAQGKILQDNKLDKTETAANSTKWNGRFFSDIFDYSGTYGKLIGQAGYIQTPLNGILPDSAGGSGNVGSSTWPFNRVYGNTIYEGDVSLSAKYLLKNDHAAGMSSHDTSYDAITPQTYSAGVKYDMKQNSYGNLNDGGTHHAVMTWRKFGTGADWSLGGALQISYSDSGNLWKRYGTGTVWGTYEKIWDSGNQGSGSGMDADTVDGKHASEFARVGINSYPSNPTVGDIRFDV